MLFRKSYYIRSIKSNCFCRNLNCSRQLFSHRMNFSSVLPTGAHFAIFIFRAWTHDYQFSILYSVITVCAVLGLWMLRVNSNLGIKIISVIALDLFHSASTHQIRRNNDNDEDILGYTSRKLFKALIIFMRVYTLRIEII